MKITAQNLRGLELTPRSKTSSYEFLPEGLNVWITHGSAGPGVAGWIPRSFPLAAASEPRFDYVTSLGDNWIEMIIGLDADGDGAQDGILRVDAGGTVYSDVDFGVDGPAEIAGAASDGSMRDFITKHPNGIITGVGFSQIAGAPSSGTLRSFSLGCRTYVLTGTVSPSPGTGCAAGVKQVEVSLANPNGFVFEDNNGTSYFSKGSYGSNILSARPGSHVTGDVPVSLSWAQLGNPSMSAQFTYGLAIRLGVDRDGDGTADAYLVNEPTVFGPRSWWSVESFGVRADRSFAAFGTLAEFGAAQPDARIVSVGFQFGPGVYGYYEIYTLTAGCTVYQFTAGDPVYSIAPFKASGYPVGTKVPYAVSVTGPAGATDLSGSYDVTISYVGFNVWADLNKAGKASGVLPGLPAGDHQVHGYFRGGPFLPPNPEWVNTRLRIYFSDYKPGSAFFEDVQWAATRWIISGVDDQSLRPKFEPATSLTRGEMLMWLHRMVMNGKDENYCAARPFKDVLVSARECGAVWWAAKDVGFVSGFSDGGFHAGRTVERQAVAAWLYRMSHDNKKAPACQKSPFRDVGKFDPFCGEIAWMKSTGITQGWSEDNTFRGTDVINREAMAVWLHRYSTLTEKTG